MIGGVDWDALAAAGLYDPADGAAADRRALLEFLVAEGCTLDEMVRAHARGRLFGLAGDRKVRPGRDEFTLREAAAETGMDLDLVTALWRAFGLAIVEADTKVASRADLDVLPLFNAIAALVGTDEALDLARVAGASIARFADATSAAMRVAVSDLGLEASGSEVATARTFAGLAELTPAVGRALDVLFRHHIETARRQFEQSESNDVATLGQVRSAVAFADVSGFTALAEAATSTDLASMLTAFERNATTLVHEVEGRVVKFIGEAVMYVTPRASTAVDVARRLVATNDHPVRAGIAYGLLLAQDGDYFGPPVNLAARLVSVAEPGQVLLAADAAERLGEGYATEPLAPRTLRGIPDPVTPYALR